MKKHHSLQPALLFASIGTACAPPPAAPELVNAPRAEVAITSSPNTSVMIFATRPSAFALRGTKMEVRSDTIRAVTPLNLTAFLNSGDLHVVAAESVDVNVDATLTQAPAKTLGARGPRIVLYAGGAGIGPPR